MLTSLKARLGLFVLLAVVVTSALSAGLLRGIHGRWLREEVLERHRLLSSHTLELVHQSMRRGDRHTLDQVLQAVGRHHGLVFLRIIDETGFVHFSSRPHELGSRVEGIGSIPLRSGMPHLMHERTDGRRVAMVVEPIGQEQRCTGCHTGSRPPGVFQVALDTTRVESKLSDGWWSLVSMLGLAQFALIGLLWLLSKRLFVKPMGRLVQSMRRVAAGDLSERVELEVPNELQVVLDQYNAMIGELSEARTELDRHYQDSLARADRLATVGEMATAMAHEIQNPLAGLGGALRVIRRDPGMQHRKDILDEMLATVSRLSKTTGDLLAYARPTEPEFDAVDVNSVVAGVVRLLGQQQEGSEVPLLEDLDVRLPAAWTDAQHLRQILINVCLNALQAIGAGPGEVVVRTRTVHDSALPHVCVEVVDDGPGIPGEVLEQVFRPFFTTKPRGTGLGLAITRRIVERAGGCIRIMSEVGAGTTVRLELPGAARPARVAECERIEEPALAVGGD